MRPGLDLTAGAAALARARRRHPASALAVLIGSPPSGTELERALIEDHRLEASNLVHVASLEGAGAEAVVDRVDRRARRRGSPRPPGATRPCGRPSAGGSCGGRRARRRAVGALPLGGADMPVLALLQVKMVAQLAALHDRPFGAERALEPRSRIVGAGFGWRAHRAQRRRPRARRRAGPWRAGCRTAVTRGLGEAALARLSAGHDLVEGPALDKVKPHIERVLGRSRRGS